MITTAAASPIVPREKMSNIQDKKVLIVEKDTGIANMIRAILAIVNIQVVHVQLGQDAMFELGEHNVGMVIGESIMPDMSGYDLLKFVRSNSKTEQVPFLMLIPEGDTTHENLPKEKAADRYITKPFTARKVLDIVKEFIVYKGL